MAVLINQPALAAALMDMCLRGGARLWHKAAATQHANAAAQPGMSGNPADSSSSSSGSMMSKVYSAAAPATFARTLLVGLLGALTGMHPCDGIRISLNQTTLPCQPGNSYANQAQAAVLGAASGSKRQQHLLSRKMASMVASCLKSLGASAMLQADRQQQRSQQTQQAHQPAAAQHSTYHLSQRLEPAGGKVWPEIDAVAVAAALCCELGTVLSQQMPAQPAASSSSSSSSQVTGAPAGPAREWVMLAAKCMLHMSEWLLQQPHQAIAATAFSTSEGALKAKAAAGQGCMAGTAGAYCHMALLLQQWHTSKQDGSQLLNDAHSSSLVLVLYGAVRTVRWLRQQLLADGLPGDSNRQAAATCLASGEQQALLERAHAVGSMLEGAAAELQLFLYRHGNSTAVDFTSMQQQLQACWEHLQAFAARVLDECPVTFCCGDPSCLNMAKLSEWQLVGGKRCVCDGCKAVRYCSRACQVKMWAKHHRQVCMRLREAPQHWLTLVRSDEIINRWLFEAGGYM
jgi:hypothetical protein